VVMIESANESTSYLNLKASLGCGHTSSNGMATT